MYRNSYQRGMLSVFFSVGSKPLEIWDIQAEEGYLTRFLDQDIKSMVLEIRGTNVSTTYITCPKGNMVLGITMPFLVMIVKNLKKYFSFEVTILDETHTRRRFRVSNFQSQTQIGPLCTVMPIGLSDGWNQIQFNLAEFTRRAYNKQYIETQKLKINANIRLRRIYFCERLLADDQLPPGYKLFFPLASKKKEMKPQEKGAVPTPSKTAVIEEILPAEVEGDKKPVTVSEASESKAEPEDHKEPEAEAVTAETEAVAAEGEGEAAETEAVTGEAEGEAAETEAVTGETEGEAAETEAVTGEPGGEAAETEPGGEAAETEATEAATAETEAVAAETEAVATETEAVAAEAEAGTEGEVVNPPEAAENQEEVTVAYAKIPVFPSFTDFSKKDYSISDPKGRKVQFKRMDAGRKYF